MARPISKLERENHKNKVAHLVILGGYTESAIAKQLGISARTVATYKKQVYEELGDFLAERGDLFRNVIMADFKARDEAWKMWMKEKKHSWLSLFNRINITLFDKLSKCGVIELAPEKIDIKSENRLTYEHFQAAYLEIKEKNEDTSTNRNKESIGRAKCKTIN